MNIGRHNKQCQSIINNKIKEYTHKIHKEEIFVEGMFIIDETKSVVKCSFESNHRHYNDVINVPSLLNPMLLLECCRQAETYIAHQLFSVDQSTAFVLKSWSLDIVKENYEEFHNKHYHAFDIHVETSNAFNAVSRLRENKYCFLIKIEEVIIAKAKFDVGYISDVYYSRLRGPVASSYCEYNAPRLAPHFVGYGSPYNSILSNFEEHSGKYRALININWSNITYNDHPHDHITGTNIVEAAKQFCFCYLSKVLDANSSEYQMIVLEADYYSYVELHEYAYVYLEEVIEFNDGDYRFLLHIVQNEEVKSKCEIQWTIFR